MRLRHEIMCDVPDRTGTHHDDQIPIHAFLLQMGGYVVEFRNVIGNHAPLGKAFDQIDGSNSLLLGQ